MKPIEVKTDLCSDSYLNDVQDIPRAFAPYLIINDNSPNVLSVRYTYENDVFTVFISCEILGKTNCSVAIKKGDELEFKRITKRFIKNVLYDFLSQKLQITLPYGSLTGVRPTKLYYELSEKTKYVKTYVVDNYRVSQEKADLIADCVKNQQGYKNTNKKRIGLFINIPFCPSKCKYCSFISTEVFRIKKELPKYVGSVEKEIASAFEICKKNGYSVRSVYVGGGTPTSIGPENLRRILKPLSALGVEFTVEAGRADAIDKETLDVLRENSVTRISVNPQTLCDETLRLVGRNHSAQDFYDAFSLARAYGFDVNTDLIAGLPNETVEVFKNSLNGCAALKPDNITIHSLSLKRGSVFTEEGMEKREFGVVAEMISYGHKRLRELGYVPYYMYRQKNTADNLENTGYSIVGKQCVYNIDMMEESATIIGLGAGSMSKWVDGDRIERFSSPKGFREYVERIDEVILRKKIFFDKE